MTEQRLWIEDPITEDSLSRYLMGQSLEPYATFRRTENRLSSVRKTTAARLFDILAREDSRAGYPGGSRHTPEHR